MIEFEGVSYTYQHESSRKRAKKAKRAEKGERESREMADWGNDPNEVWALRDVSFTLGDGEFFGIAGHTGSGKSTLIQHMNGLLVPTRGRVLVNGSPVSSPDAAARAGLGMVFQYPERQLFAATVFDDVVFGPRNLGCGAQECEGRYGRAMGLTGLDAQALREANPFELSGGQQRRVAFAGVLAMEPSMLVLDEPVAGLDPKAREDFLQFIWSLHRDQGLTVVMVSHDMNDLARFCTRVLLLNQGRMHALGTPAEVFADGDDLKSIGLEQPAAQRLGNALTARGVELEQPQGLFTLESLTAAVARAWNGGRA